MTIIPALFSALRVSRCVKCVELDVQRRQIEWDDDEPLEPERCLWEWAAYALFSRHAEHSVEQVILHVDHLGNTALEAVEEIVRASHPLDILFDSDFERGLWISASRFFILKPRLDDHSVFITPRPMQVQVIDSTTNGQIPLWRVLLPGCGMAWVKHSEATLIAPPNQRTCSVEDESRQGVRPLHLLIEGFVEQKKAPLLSLLRLVPSVVNSIELEIVDRIQHGFDVTEWTLDVLRALPNLERLKFPWNAGIERLSIFAEAAEAGYCRLRYLSLNQTFYPDSTDIIDFLDVLCDASHPLTRQLQEINFSVSVSDHPTRDFYAAWRRLLKNNRTLHTISLFLWGNEYADEDAHDVAIRTGPLDLASKLAFLSIVQESDANDSRARGRLDTGVIGTIFAFAAPHRVRKIEIEQEFD